MQEQQLWQATCAEASDIHGIHAGADGWLFLLGGSNNVFRLFADPSYFDNESASAWADLITERTVRLNELGVQYVHMWVPDKLTVYTENLRFDPAIMNLDPTGMVTCRLSNAAAKEAILDLRPCMLRAKSDGMLFWKTDTHWTYQGACVAYRALCEKLDVLTPSNILDRPIHRAVLSLDLGGKLSPPIKEEWGAAQILQTGEIVYKNDLVRFLEILNPQFASPMLRGTSVVIRNKSKASDPRRAVIFGDSFSEFRPHLMTGLVGETFRETMFVWSSAIDYDLVAEFEPDILIFEAAERFITTCPDDKLNLRTFAAERIVAFLNQRCANDVYKFVWRS